MDRPSGDGVEAGETPCGYIVGDSQRFGNAGIGDLLCGKRGGYTEPMENQLFGRLCSQELGWVV